MSASDDKKLLLTTVELSIGNGMTSKTVFFNGVVVYGKLLSFVTSLQFGRLSKYEFNHFHTSTFLQAFKGYSPVIKEWNP